MLASYYNETGLEAGTDEAGRGCLAGPVTAAAVVLPKDFYHPLLNDSKQMSSTQRDLLRKVIEAEALAWAVAEVSPAEIDKINILQASFLAMHHALDGLSVRPELILVDGNRFRTYGDTPHLCVVKGDSKYTSIAAASVLAKTHRDARMKELDEQFPEYGWRINKGYPTLRHRAAIREFGPTQWHRRSFALLPQGEQLRLDF